MAGVTINGYESKSFQDVTDDIDQNYLEEYGTAVPTTPDSTPYVHTRVLAREIKNLWDLGEALSSQQDPDTATGAYLESLARINGLNRLQPSGSTGFLVFTGTVGGSVPSFFPVSDDGGRRVLSQQSVSYNRTECYESTYSVNTVANNTDYTITIDGTAFTVTSSGAATEEEILLDLENTIGDQAFYQIVDRPETNQIRVRYKNRINLLSSTNSSNITLVSVGTVVTATAIDNGALSFPTDTLINLDAPNLYTLSVTNPADFSLGRSLETNEELRTRLREKQQSSGTATVPAIESKVSDVAGVSAVYVIENNNLVTDGDGRPGKTYETIVTGGDAETVAQAIWVSKPAGIATYGSETQAVIDNQGNVQTVKFSRPTPLYAWVEFDYVVNDEEAFPSGGEDLMKQAIVDFGSAMYSGEDFEPSKFYGPLYDKVKGAYYSNIQIATTLSEGGTPTYQSTRIEIDVTENLVFDTNRVVVNPPA